MSAKRAKMPQHRPKTAQDHPRSPQNRSREAQDRPREPQDGPRTPQERPKTQLENASAVNSISKGGSGYTAGIYSPPTPYRQDYVSATGVPVSDHHIYSIRGGPGVNTRGQFHNIYADPAAPETWREYNR